MDALQIVQMEKEGLMEKIKAPLNRFPEERVESELEIHAQLRVLRRVEQGILARIEHVRGNS